MSKMALKARVRALVRTQRAQTVAKNCWGTFRKKCAEVAQRRGAAISS